MPGTLQPNDYVIWRRKKICQIVERLPPVANSEFMRPANAFVPVAPAGLTREEWARTCDDVARFRLLDLDSEQEFEAEGYDLLGPVNAMEVLGAMARKQKDVDGHQ